MVHLKLVSTLSKSMQFLAMNVLIYLAEIRVMSDFWSSFNSSHSNTLVRASIKCFVVL